MEFESVALKLFSYQVETCDPYRQYVNALGIDPMSVNRLDQIPFLPIEIFKTCDVYCGDKAPEKVFKSSGTSGMIQSQHLVADLSLYEESFVNGFTEFYGRAEGLRIFALLPGYLERGDSSLVYMVDKLIAMGSGGGFFLHDHDRLIVELRKSLADGHKTILIGVSFALLDLVEKYSLDMPELIIMETGGMKNQRKEMSRCELHDRLCHGFNVEKIHSEYGMTELLSQGYSAGDGIFRTPKWLRVVTRDLSDPLSPTGHNRRGGLNVIDLANVYSCSFIETGDMGITYSDNTFTVEGRIKGEVIRGCNMLLE